jgi:hypothetical protein
MCKKILAFCAALMALAVVPAVASASPELTAPTGTTLAVGSKIQATNVGNTLMSLSTGGEVVCTEAKMTGTLKANSGTLVEGDIETASFNGTEGEEKLCSSPLGPVKVTTGGFATGLPWCIKTTKTSHQFEVRGGKCSEPARAMTYIMDIGGIACPYSRAALVGTFKTHPEDALLTVSEQEFTREGTNFFCPSSGKLNMTFTLETDPVGASASPIYIS